MSIASHETISTAVDDPAKALEIIRALPPEEREKIQVKNGQIIGPAEIVHNVRDLLSHDRSSGTSGD